MRRILILAVVLGLWASSATAAEWRLGLQGGVNNTSLNGDTPSGVKIGKRTGMQAGAIGEFRLNDEVWLSFQPMYQQAGTTTSFRPEGESEDVDGPTLELNYFAIPILARISSSNGRTYVMGGLNPAFLMDAKLQDGDTSEDLSSEFSDFSLAADIAFGYVVPIRRTLLTLEIRYEQSILNLAADGREEGEDVLPERFRSSGFQFMAGLLWPLGGK